MPKSTTDSRSIQITEFAFNKIMSWAQATNEIVFLNAGRNGVIMDAFRLKNISDKPKVLFEYCEKDESKLRKEIQSQGLNVIMGHSHPHKNSIRFPSKTDVRELPAGSLQMIVFPIEKKVGIWEFQKTYSETLKNCCSVEIISTAK